MSAISDNLQVIRQRIRESAVSFGRYDSSICLIAVSKTRSADEILLAARRGQRDFGENYAREGVGKILALREKFVDTTAPLVWHFIGPLQSNKTLLVAENFDWAHSIARAKIAERLATQRPEHLPPLQVLLEVNVSGEASKSGCAPEEVLPLCRLVMTLPGLTLRGLMCIPAPSVDFAAQRRPFARLYALWEELRKEGLPLDTLSMGMSDDFPAAIAEGGNMLRIGTAIFGART
ncbi:MAG: YggS family pyridoxal phosphate-dependent enzyme [Betaproteobacteria bacterium]|nr:YggS family pyridoxal phosphate-dependent enzyme [Betaproteobacteria bacterium]